MKTTVLLSGMYRAKVSKILWQKLEKLVPETTLGELFTFTFDSQDPRINKIIDVFRQAGLKPQKSLASEGADGEFFMSMRRSYDPDELNSFELLRVYSELLFWGDISFDENVGFCVLQPELFRKHRRGVLDAGWRGLIVSDPIRRVMEDEAVKAVKFAPLVLCDHIRPLGAAARTPKISWSRIPNGPWWILSSSRTLPSVSQSMNLRDNMGNSVGPGYQNGCHAVEGIFSDPELIYTRSRLKNVKPFDISLTVERWGDRVSGHDVLDRMLVVSKRFYNLAVKHKWKMEFQPVRIDEDL